MNKSYDQLSLSPVAQDKFEINGDGTREHSPLLPFAERGCRGTALQRLLTRDDVNVNIQNKDNLNTPFVIAIRRGNKNIIRQPLKRKNINVNQLGSEGKPPLVIVAESGNCDIMDLFMGCKDLYIDITLANGVTPLWISASKGYTGTVEVFLENKTHLKTKDTHGSTPVRISVHNGNIERVKVFLKKGADTNSKASSGRIPLFMSANNRH